MMAFATYLVSSMSGDRTSTIPSVTLAMVAFFAVASAIIPVTDLVIS